MYKVVSMTLWHNGKKYKRGDMVDADHGVRTEWQAPPVAVEKPKRKRRVKKEAVNED